jgi:hypothetical protein
LLRVVPGMTLGHRPSHLAIFLLPIVAVLAASGMRALLAQGRRGVLAVLLVLAVVEYAVLPLPTLPFDAHPAYARLQQAPGAVLELPPDERTAAAMRHQMIHGQPIVGGYLARQPPVPPFVEELPWLRELWDIRLRNRPDIVAERPDTARQALSYYGIRRLVVRHADLHPVARRNLPGVLAALLPGVPPAYEQDGISIYALAPPDEPQPFAYLGDGWLGREHRNNERVWRWMGEHATVRLVNPAAQAQPVTLALTAESYERARPLTLHLDAAPLGTFEMRRAARTLRMRVLLPPGEHTLHLRSEADTEPAGPRRELSLSFSRIVVTSADGG